VRNAAPRPDPRRRASRSAGAHTADPFRCARARLTALARGRSPSPGARRVWLVAARVAADRAARRLGALAALRRPVRLGLPAVEGALMCVARDAEACTLGRGVPHSPSRALTPPCAPTADRRAARLQTRARGCASSRGCWAPPSTRAAGSRLRSRVPLVCCPTHSLHLLLRSPRQRARSEFTFKKQRVMKSEVCNVTQSS
jgi:hypothetical protein